MEQYNKLYRTILEKQVQLLLTSINSQCKTENIPMEFSYVLSFRRDLHLFSIVYTQEISTRALEILFHFANDMKVPFVKFQPPYTIIFSLSTFEQNIQMSPFTQEYQDFLQFLNDNLNKKIDLTLKSKSDNKNYHEKGILKGTANSTNSNDPLTIFLGRGRINIYVENLIAYNN